MLDWLERWALYTPNAIALSDADTGVDVTYLQLYRQSVRLAHELGERYGIGHGDRVAVLAGNEPELFTLFFACGRLGAMLVPLNVRLSTRELDHILSDCDAKVLVVHPELESLLPQLPHAPAERFGFAALKALQPDDHQVPWRATLSDPVMVLYTSGTTGFPKGALITHQMVNANSISTGLRLDLTSKDVTLHYLPMFHTSGWHVLNTPFLHRGAKLVLLKKFEPQRILQLIDDQQVTVLFGVPTTMGMLAARPEFDTTSMQSVRFAIVGGEPMPVELIHRYGQKKIPTRQGFGLTEFGPNVFSLNAEDSVRKIGSIGFPNMGIEVKLVADDGSEVHGDGVGELALKGPQCTPGYFRNDKATADTIRDGWFFTGDLLRRDADGYFFVAGRKKDMFISGGENVYPVEVERYLSTHPKIREVAVIGVKDATWGEVGKAFVSVVAGQQLTPGEVIDFCKGNLAKYKIPKHVEVLDDLPKGDSGKLLKRALVERERQRS